MWILLIVIVLLALLGLLGAVIEGLLWLAFATIVLFAIAAVFGWFKVRSFLRGRSTAGGRTDGRPS